MSQIALNTPAPASALIASGAERYAASAPQRAAMIDSQLRTSDVTDTAVVAAMARVPREDYLPEGRAEFAYIDRAIPLTADRAMNAPLATGRLLVAAGVQPGDRVLLIGAAGGYTAAVLAAMGAVVTAVEDDTALLALAGAALADEPLVTLVNAPLAGGAPEAAPYDRVIIEGAVDAVPAAIAAQVKDGGVLVCGLTDGAVTRLARGIQVAGQVVPVPFADVGCVALPQFRSPPRFQF